MNHVSPCAYSLSIPIGEGETTALLAATVNSPYWRVVFPKPTRKPCYSSASANPSLGDEIPRAFKNSASFSRASRSRLLQVGSGTSMI